MAPRGRGDRHPGGQSLRELVDQGFLGEAGGFQVRDQLLSLALDVLMLRRVDGRVGFLGLMLVDALVDHLLDGEPLLGDDFTEVADPGWRDDVFPGRKA